MPVLDFIGVGRDNAVPREYLMEATGLSDREVRKEIEKARKNGYIIINRQDGKGYYISDNTDDLLQQYKQNKRRAMSILVQQKYLRKKLKELGVEVI